MAKNGEFTREKHEKDEKKSKQPAGESDDNSIHSTMDSEDKQHLKKKKKDHSGSKRKERTSSSRRRHNDESYSDTESDSESDYSDSDSGSEYSDSVSEDSEERRRRKKKERKKREERERERRRKRKREKEKKKKRRGDFDDSDDSDDDYKRKRLKKKKNNKEKRGKDDHKKKKKKKKEKGKIGAVTDSWGKYGIVREVDMWNKRPEFTAWLAEVKQVNLESMSNWEEKKMFKEYMEDYNTATFSSKKYYDLDAYHRRKMEKAMNKGFKKVVDTERTVFDDEEQRRLELMQAREKQKEQEVEALKNAMKSGMAQAMKEQARLKEEMAYLFKIGNHEAAAAIQKRLDPDVPM